MAVNVRQFTKDGRFLMLAIDQRGSFRRILNPQAPETVTDEEMILVKAKIIETLQDQFSAVLIDPKYGLPAYKNKNKPYLLCIEKSGYMEKDGERITELEYSVGDLKQMGAFGIKLNLQFNPSSVYAKEQLQLAGKVLADSHRAGLPLFLEIIAYKSPVIDAIRPFITDNIIPDVFKLEYPGEAAACDEITKLVGTTPWILLTGGKNYEIFKNELETAALHGASGFLAGRAIWQEISQQNYQLSVASARFREISDIVGKKAFLA